MVECPFSSSFARKYFQVKPNRASFQVLDTKNETIILNFDNLLVCNENPNRNFVDLAACTMVSDDHIYRIPEWLEYHRLIGFQRFTIHIDSPNFEIYQRFLQNYIDRHPKVIELVPFYFETQRRPEDASRHDCLYRNRGFAKYTGVFDVDEFFQMKLKNQTLLQYLDRTIESASSHWSGVAVPTFFFRHCENKPIGDFQMAIEAYQVRDETSNSARRKSIYLTEQISYVGAHSRLGGEKIKIIDPAQELAVNHYRYPPLPMHKSKAQVLLVRDSSMFKHFAKFVKLNLKNANFIIEDLPIDYSSFSCGQR